MHYSLFELFIKVKLVEYLLHYFIWIFVFTSYDMIRGIHICKIIIYYSSSILLKKMTPLCILIYFLSYLFKNKQMFKAIMHFIIYIFMYFYYNTDRTLCYSYFRLSGQPWRPKMSILSVCAAMKTANLSSHATHQRHKYVFHFSRWC